MCGLCGDLTPAEHWSDRGDGPSGVRHRHERLRAIRLLINGTGLTVSDWKGAGYVLGNGRGRSAVVRDLGELWKEAERMLGRPVDPLGAGVEDSSG